MTTRLYEDRFGEILLDEQKKILELQWRDDTDSMSDEDFKRWLELYASYGEKHRTPFMLIDARHFKHRPSPQVMPWRDVHIIPRYNGAGVKKFAFLLPAGAAPGTQPSPEVPATFPTGYFDSRERVETWFDA